MAIIQMEACRCERCGHEWIPRGEELPVICPKCKSARWNRPRKVKS